MNKNAAGLIVSGESNPNWKGGLLDKTCQVCGTAYQVKKAHSASKFCSLKCVGVSQRGKPSPRTAPSKRVMKDCEVCAAPYSVFESHAHRHHCCSKACSHKRRAAINKGDGNPNWNGGLSRLPYPWNFREISKAVIARDGFACQNPSCSGTDKRLTTHHINYEKQDCRPENLIALCSACNSKANFGREEWTVFYQNIIAIKKGKGGKWELEEF